MLLRNFIIDSNKVATSRDLIILWHLTMSKLGFDRLLFTLLMEHKTIGRKAGHVAALRYPQAWLAQYSANRFEEADPVHHHMFITKGAFTWESLKNSDRLDHVQEAILDMAGRAGLNNGVGIPLRGPSGELAAVMAASSASGPLLKAEALDYTGLITEQFYTVFLRLEHKAKRNSAALLTDKERQVLMLCAQGRSRPEIAIALGLTTDAVKYRLKGIFTKLEAANQEVAVLKATAMGLISSVHVRKNKPE